MQRIVLVIAVSLGLTGMVMGRPHAQTRETVFLSLISSSDVPVEGLLAGEVEILEDGVACRTIAVEPVRWPMTVTLLVDNGPATTAPLNLLRSGVRGLLDALPDDVQVSLWTTSPNPRSITKPTTDRNALMDGVNAIVALSSGGMFFDALVDTVNRIQQAPGESFPVVVVVASDAGAVPIPEREFKRLQGRLVEHQPTVHVAMVTSGALRTDPRLAPSASGRSNVARQQLDVARMVTGLTGGAYEELTAPARLATLLPEWGKQIAAVRQRQRLQYRITYERASQTREAASVSARVSRPGIGHLSRSGPMPQPD